MESSAVSLRWRLPKAGTEGEQPSVPPHEVSLTPKDVRAEIDDAAERNRSTAARFGRLQDQPHRHARPRRLLERSLDRFSAV